MWIPVEDCFRVTDSTGFFILILCFQQSDTSTAPVVCTTPEGEGGHCMGIQNCPILLANLDRLRKSVCFQSLFSIGVCCPDLGYMQKFSEKSSVDVKQSFVYPGSP